MKIKIMKLEYGRLTDKKLPVIDTPLEVTSIRIWFCKYKDISSISECKNLKKLEIA